MSISRYGSVRQLTPCPHGTTRKTVIHSSALIFFQAGKISTIYFQCFVEVSTESKIPHRQILLPRLQGTCESSQSIIQRFNSKKAFNSNSFFHLIRSGKKLLEKKKGGRTRQNIRQGKHGIFQKERTPFWSPFLCTENETKKKRG